MSSTGESVENPEGIIEIEADETEDLANIKGDAIGDTLYSERWVLKTLIKLSNISADSWDTDFEEELCALWDMTAEKDVALFLLSNDFYSIFLKVIEVTNNARCIEIVVGIVGNMSCVETARESLAVHDAGCTVLNLITSEDSLVLVQVVRLLNTCLWNLRIEEPESTRPNSPTFEEEDENMESETESEPTKPWLTLMKPHRELILRHLGFFLSSSTNADLLCSSLDLLDTLFSIPSLRLAAPASAAPELAAGLTECLRQLLRGARVGDSLTANRKLFRSIQVWMGLVGQVASCQKGRVNLGAYGDILTKCFTKLLLLLTTPEALKTQEPEMATLTLCVLETLPLIRVSNPVLARLTKVLFDLHQDIEELVAGCESIEVKNLLTRAVKFLTLRLEECDDLVSLLQGLHPEHQEFLKIFASQIPDLKSKVERSLLQISTNGLVQ